MYPAYIACLTPARTNNSIFFLSFQSIHVNLIFNGKLKTRVVLKKFKDNTLCQGMQSENTLNVCKVVVCRTRGGVDAYKGPRKRRDIVWTPFFCGNGCRERSLYNLLW